MIGAFIDGVMSSFLVIEVDRWPDSPVAILVELARLNAKIATFTVLAAM